MSGGFGEMASKPTQSSSFSNNSGSNNGDCGNFECIICMDLAQDPIVTMCGHLFCWPCIYIWLNMHSKSHECPTCKAYIEEGKLVPLYGTGKNSADSTSKRGGNIPKRPAGQRPESGQQANRNEYGQHGSRIIAVVRPAITASFGNFTLFAGIIPSILNVHLHPFNYRGHPGHVFRQQREHHHDVSPILIIGLLFLFFSSLGMSILAISDQTTVVFAVDVYIVYCPLSIALVQGYVTYL